MQQLDRGGEEQVALGLGVGLRWQRDLRDPDASGGTSRASSPPCADVVAAGLVRRRADQVRERLAPGL